MEFAFQLAQLNQAVTRFCATLLKLSLIINSFLLVFITLQQRQFKGKLFWDQDSDTRRQKF